MEKILLTGGKLLDQSEGLVMAQKDILLEDGRIAAIDDHIDAPQGARVIDVTGRIVAPGFIDIHAHIFPGCPKLGIEAEPALLAACRKFTDRMAKMEILAKKQGQDLAKMPLTEQDALWERAKKCKKS